MAMKTTLLYRVIMKVKPIYPVVFPAWFSWKSKLCCTNQHTPIGPDNLV